MEDIIERLNHLLRFHDSQVERFRDDKEAQEFHKGAVMAFSKCQVLLDCLPHNKLPELTGESRADSNMPDLGEDRTL